jgi:hypothetical protein
LILMKKMGTTTMKAPETQVQTGGESPVQGLSLSCLGPEFCASGHRRKDQFWGVWGKQFAPPFSIFPCIIIIIILFSSWIWTLVLAKLGSTRSPPVWGTFTC